MNRQEISNEDLEFVLSTEELINNKSNGYCCCSYIIRRGMKFGEVCGQKNFDSRGFCKIHTKFYIFLETCQSNPQVAVLARKYDVKEIQNGIPYTSVKISPRITSCV